MRVGICAGGAGPEVTPEFLSACGRAAEVAGFSTIWFGEHVALFDDYSRSAYPYAAFAGSGHSGSVPFPDPRTPVADPLIAMAWAAAATTTIEVANGILILPQRNPVVLAKQLATLDTLSQGRVVLGAGLGWCQEEYAAIGVPWSGRGRRMDEYLESLRLLLAEDAAEFHGSTVGFSNTYVYPRPVRQTGLPILIGGESDAALRRVARYGDGWIAFQLGVDEASDRIELLASLTRQQDRDPATLRIVVGIFPHTTSSDIDRYREAGVTDFNLVVGGQLPLSEPDLSAVIGELGAEFIDAAAGVR